MSAATDSLAVFTSDLGASFIDLHLANLSPGRTVAVGSTRGRESLLSEPSSPLPTSFPGRTTGTVFPDALGRRSARQRRRDGERVESKASGVFNSR